MYMNENQKKLIIEFKKTASKRWIKGVNNFTNSVGLAFESLLNKKLIVYFFLITKE